MGLKRIPFGKNRFTKPILTGMKTKIPIRDLPNTVIRTRTIKQVPTSVLG